jgi:hypothetical protein
MTVYDSNDFSNDSTAAAVEAVGHFLHEGFYRLWEERTRMPLPRPRPHDEHLTVIREGTGSIRTYWVEQSDSGGVNPFWEAPWTPAFEPKPSQRWINAQKIRSGETSTPNYMTRHWHRGEWTDPGEYYEKDDYLAQGGWHVETGAQEDAYDGFPDKTPEEIAAEINAAYTRAKRARTLKGVDAAIKDWRWLVLRLHRDDVSHLFFPVFDLLRYQEALQVFRAVLFEPKHHAGPEVRAVVLRLKAATDWSYRKIERVTGVPRSTASDWVSGYRNEQANLLKGESTMKTELPKIIERVASLEQQMVEHDDRLTDTERQLGLPPGGEAAAARVVDQLIAEVQNPRETEENGTRDSSRGDRQGQRWNGEMNGEMNRKMKR